MSTALASSGVTAPTETTPPTESRAEDLEPFRRELAGYCYRMLGSSLEADDAVQETMIRAWRNLDRFEGRSSLRSWLYRIATNVCLDMQRSPQRRARPMDMGPAHRADGNLGDALPESTWLEPIPDAKVVQDTDPGEMAATRETIKLAFVAALQHLPPKQRAVLILREVLRWHADEVAELLDSSVASVNSALQRARATLASREIDPLNVEVMGAEQQALLARYVDAFERYDIESLVALLHEDAIMSMPPFDFWLTGPEQMGAWFLGQGHGCKGSRLVPTFANGCAAFGSYRVDPDGGHMPFAVQVIEISGDRIVGHHNFLDTKLFALFGLPEHLDD